jgi:hypothetical protein
MSDLVRTTLGGNQGMLLEIVGGVVKLFQIVPEAIAVGSWRCISLVTIRRIRTLAKLATMISLISGLTRNKWLGAASLGFSG